MVMWWSYWESLPDMMRRGRQYLGGTRMKEVKRRAI